MGEKIIEVIPFKTFRERLKLTKSLMNKGITPINLGNSLYVNYSTKRGAVKC